MYNYNNNFPTFIGYLKGEKVNNTISVHDYLLYLKFIEEMKTDSRGNLAKKLVVNPI